MQMKAGLLAHSKGTIIKWLMKTSCHPRQKITALNVTSCIKKRKKKRPHLVKTIMHELTREKCKGSEKCVANLPLTQTAVPLCIEDRANKCTHCLGTLRKKKPNWQRGVWCPAGVAEGRVSESWRGEGIDKSTAQASASYHPYLLHHWAVTKNKFPQTSVTPTRMIKPWKSLNVYNMFLKHADRLKT